MRTALLACFAFLAVGCARGVPSSSVTYGAASYQAVGPAERFGTRPMVYSTLTIPGDVTACVAEGAAKGIVVVGDTVRCVLNRLIPPPVVEVQRVEAPAAAPCLPALPLRAAPMKACPEPVSVGPVCAGNVCAVAR